MPVPAELKALLVDAGVMFEILPHTQAYTSIEEARSLGVVADQVAKTVVVRTRAGDVLAVVPGGHRLSMRKMQHELDDTHARLATEDELAADFPGYELGAVPPCGGKVSRVFLDQRLLETDTIVFPAGSHAASVKMKAVDLVKVCHPTVADLARELDEERARPWEG
ncbi:MAG: YbaK/EbsC family protein [Actinomycetota bacterium]